MSSKSGEKIVDWSHLPSNAGAGFNQFEVNIPKDQIDKLQAALDASIVGPETFFTQDPSFKYGVTHKWITQAREYWLHKFSWREAEQKINRHPHFKTEITDSNGEKYEIHFMGLFSRRRDAIPIAFFHGWPGSFLEFMEIFDIVKSRWTPETSPYHFVAPSLPGFPLSTGPPIKRSFDVGQVSALMDKLLVKLGFENGYVAQGGDVGSAVSQGLAHVSDRAKVTFLLPIKPPNDPEPENDPEITDAEREGLVQSQEWVHNSSAYSIEQRTRPSTIGFVLSSNPLALLAWSSRIGEKMHEWADPIYRLPLELIVTEVSLYWLTNTISRSLYPYQAFDVYAKMTLPPYIKQPFGYSVFAKELLKTPKKWAAAEGNLVFYKHHKHGGHFMGWENPTALWNDVEEFVKTALPNGLPITP